MKDRLQFDQKCRVVYIGDGEAFMLLVGMYITRGLITTVRKSVCLSLIKTYQNMHNIVHKKTIYIQNT